MISEAIVPHFQRMAETHPVLLVRDKVEEAGEVVALERLAIGELPVDRTEAVAERGLLEAS